LQPISPRLHGFIDYPLALIIAALPWVLGLNASAVGLGLLVGAIMLAMSIFTAYPAGLGKAIRFRHHRTIELTLAVFLLASPWLFQFSGEPRSRNYELAIGVVIATLALLTHPTWTRAASSPLRERRS
jgi:SPW repeat